MDNIEIRKILENQMRLLEQESEYCADNGSDPAGLAQLSSAMVVIAGALGYPIEPKEEGGD